METDIRVIVKYVGIIVNTNVILSIKDIYMKENNGIIEEKGDHQVLMLFQNRGLLK